MWITRDVGFASEKLKGTGNCKPSERQVLEFRIEGKTCLVQLLEKMLEKCLASYSLVRHLSCLNPVEMAPNKDACSAKFKKVLRLLVNAERVKEEECDTLLQQFAMFLDSIPVFGSERFANFQSVEDRVDTLWMHGKRDLQESFQCCKTYPNFVTWTGNSWGKFWCQQRGRSWEFEGTYSSSSK